jgi:hypothetical protein
MPAGNDYNKPMCRYRVLVLHIIEQSREIHVDGQIVNVLSIKFINYVIYKLNLLEC